MLQLHLPRHEQGANLHVCRRLLLTHFFNRGRAVLFEVGSEREQEVQKSPLPGHVSCCRACPEIGDTAAAPSRVMNSSRVRFARTIPTARPHSHPPDESIPTTVSLALSASRFPSIAKRIRGA